MASNEATRTPCSTPFGITEVGTYTIPARQHGRNRPEVECSTPFGITEVGTKNFQPTIRRRPLCSTPFGITEVGTRAGLAAPALLLKRCSTPFGITEVGTERSIRAAATSLLSPVLNAFRHHRGRHTSPKGLPNVI